MTTPLVTLHLWRVSPRDVPRALVRMATDRSRARKTPGVRFEETSRFYRGRVVAALGESLDGLSLAQLGELLRPGFAVADSSWLLGIVDGLARDGLVVPADSRTLREVAERYDGSVELSRVYRLPE